MSKGNTTNVSSSGTSIAGLLGVAFVVLKLMGIITWSWWWVTAPFWGGLAIGLTLVIGGGLLVGVVAGVIAIVDSRSRRLARKRNTKRLGR